MNPCQTTFRRFRHAGSSVARRAEVASGSEAGARREGGFGAGTAGDERVAEAIGREHLGEEGGRAARVGPVEVRASSLDDGEAEGEDEVGVLGETRAEVAE